MRRLLLAVLLVLASRPASAQMNCLTLNGTNQCAAPLRLFDATPRGVSLPVLDLTQSWNNPSVTFTGLRLNITDTNSASGSLLADWQVNGVSKFGITKTGAFTTGGLLGLGTTSTSGFILNNLTPSTATTTVQISPAFRQCGTGYNSTSAASETDCFFTEVLPATVAGTTTALWKLGSSIAGGATSYPLTLSNAGVLITNTVQATTGTSFFGAVDVGSTNTILWDTRTRITSPADGQVTFTNFGITAGVGLDVATNGLGIVRTTAQNADADWRAASFQGIQKVLLKSSGTTATQVATAQTTVPTCTTNCGTPGNVCVGTDTAGICTMGTTPASGFVIAFNGTWAAAPSCIVQAALAGMVTGKKPLTSVASTTIVTVVTDGTAPVAGDKYAYLCIGLQ